MKTLLFFVIALYVQVFGTCSVLKCGDFDTVHIPRSRPLDLLANIWTETDKKDVLMEVCTPTGIDYFVGRDVEVFADSVKWRYYDEVIKIPTDSVISISIMPNKGVGPGAGFFGGAFLGAVVGGLAHYSNIFGTEYDEHGNRREPTITFTPTGALIGSIIGAVAGLIAGSTRDGTVWVFDQ